MIRDDLADAIGMAPIAKTSPESTPERRRRKRLRGTTPGWIMFDNPGADQPWEVRVRDVSRHGVGFESAEQIEDGQIVRIRIGRGPLELSKRIRVVRCHPGQRGTYTVGGEFV